MLYIKCLSLCQIAVTSRKKKQSVSQWMDNECDGGIFLVCLIDWYDSEISCLVNKIGAQNILTWRARSKNSQKRTKGTIRILLALWHFLSPLLYHINNLKQECPCQMKLLFFTSISCTHRQNTKWYAYAMLNAHVCVCVCVRV